MLILDVIFKPNTVVLQDVGKNVAPVQSGSFPRGLGAAPQEPCQPNPSDGALLLIYRGFSARLKSYG